MPNKRTIKITHLFILLTQWKIYKIDYIRYSTRFYKNNNYVAKVSQMQMFTLQSLVIYDMQYLLHN